MSRFQPARHRSNIQGHQQYSSELFDLFCRVVMSLSNRRVEQVRFLKRSQKWKQIEVETFWNCKGNQYNGSKWSTEDVDKLNQKRLGNVALIWIRFVVNMSLGTWETNHCDFQARRPCSAWVPCSLWISPKRSHRSEHETHERPTKESQKLEFQDAVPCCAWRPFSYLLPENWQCKVPRCFALNVFCCCRLQINLQSLPNGFLCLHEC